MYFTFRHPVKIIQATIIFPTYSKRRILGFSYFHFLGWEFTKHLLKTKDLEVLQIKLYWSKILEMKGKCKFNPSSILKIIPLSYHNRSFRKLVFVSLFNPFLHFGTWPKIFKWPNAIQKTVWSIHNFFFLQNIRSNNPVRVNRHTNKQFKVV